MKTLEYIKSYAEEQRTTVSEIFTQFVLNLKRTVVNEPTEIILADPNFKKSLLDTISKKKAIQKKVDMIIENPIALGEAFF